MLFDLRGKRKRLVQAIYLGLAILMGGGLVFFGIGGDVSGGLFDAFKGSGGGTSFDKEIERAEKRLALRPGDTSRDRPVLLSLARLHFQAANSGGNVDQNTGAYSEDGLKELQAAVSAWERYLKTKPQQPNAGTALLAVRAYEVLQDFAAAARAQRVVARARPSRGALTQLATYLYYAGKIGEGDEIAARALARTPSGQRKGAERRLNLAKYGQLAVNAYLDGKVKQGDAAGRKAVQQVPAQERPAMRKRLRDLKKRAAAYRRQQQAERRAQAQGQPGRPSGTPPPNSPFSFPSGGGVSP
jgi:tetratricopeptide (TPR) repeat protein